MAIAVPETYWVEPGKLLAGPYPASASRADTIRRLRTLLSAGVTSFVDLTEVGERPVYADLLKAVADSSRRKVQYTRKPLVDHKVPLARETMVDILEGLVSARTGDQCVYLHCRAGIGRTGMVAACYLIEGGMAPDAALEHLQQLWEKSGRSAVWPHTPETEEQTEYVRKWSTSRDSPWWKPWS